MGDINYLIFTELDILISSVFLVFHRNYLYRRFPWWGLFHAALPRPQRVYSPQTRSYFTLGLGLLTHEDIENLGYLWLLVQAWDSGLPQLILFYSTIGVNV